MTDLFLAFHTDDVRLIKLACDFWELDASNRWQYSVKELESATGLSRRDLIEHVHQAATAVCRAIHCTICNIPLVIEKRADLPQNAWRYVDWKCGDCTAKQLAEERRLVAEQEQRENQRLTEILDALKSDNTEYEYYGAPFYDAIVACSIMIQSELACDTGKIGNIASLGLSAGDDLARRLAAMLHNSGMIRFGNATTISSLSANSTETRYTYYSLLVDWRMAPPAHAESFREVFGILNNRLEGPFDSEEIDAIRSLWWDTARDAVEDHLRGQLRQYGLPEFNVGDKFREAFDYMLQRFSVPKARYLIYRVAKNAAALSTRVDFNRGRAINTIPGAIIRDCDRAIADNWNISGFTYKWDTEEPQLFTIIFDRLLRTGVSGFRMTSGSHLEQLLQGMVNDYQELDDSGSGSGTIQ
jgi:hypothetical protein